MTYEELDINVRSLSHDDYQKVVDFVNGLNARRNLCSEPDVAFVSEKKRNRSFSPSVKSKRIENVATSEKSDGLDVYAEILKIQRQNGFGVIISEIEHAPNYDSSISIEEAIARWRKSVGPVDDSDEEDRLVDEFVNGLRTKEEFVCNDLF